MNKDYINICKNARIYNYTISSKADLFKNEYLKVDFFEDYIVISSPTIDYMGKQYKSCKNKVSNWCHIGIKNERLKEGKFFIDKDDSTEDELVIYCL